MKTGKFIYYTAIAFGITILLLVLSDPNVNIIPIVEPLYEMFDNFAKEDVILGLRIFYTIIAFGITLVLISRDKKIEDTKKAIKDFKYVLLVQIFCIILGRFL